MAEQLRAYRFALDLTEAQASAVAQHAGAARWAYNHALAAKFAALNERREAIKLALAAGADLVVNPTPPPTGRPGAA